MPALTEFTKIPAGRALIGTKSDEIDRCLSFWGNSVVEAGYTDAEFRTWIQKEVPQYSTYVEDFWISIFPVTNRQFKEFTFAMGRTQPKSITLEEPLDCPVWGVGVGDCLAYCAWLSECHGKTYILPTEVQWEYAASGPEHYEYPFGKNFNPAACNTRESGIGRTTPVDAFPQGKSVFGVWDMAGNVEEWTANQYQPYPGGSWISDEPSRFADGTYNVLRGGCYALGGDLARCARRHGPSNLANHRYHGFRLILTDH